MAEVEEVDYKPEYNYVYNGETKSGQLSYEHRTGFTYYDKETGKITTVPYANGGEITTLKGDYYNYKGSSCLADITPAYKMIFRKADDSAYAKYWLADTCVVALDTSVCHNMRVTLEGYISGGNLFAANGSARSVESEVRTVVTLASNVEVFESATKGMYDVRLP